MLMYQISAHYVWTHGHRCAEELARGEADCHSVAFWLERTDPSARAVAGRPATTRRARAGPLVRRLLLAAGGRPAQCMLASWSRTRA